MRCEPHRETSGLSAIIIKLMYTLKMMLADSKRSLKEYRQRQWIKKHFVLGRERQKGDEKVVQITSMFLLFGTVLTGSFT